MKARQQANANLAVGGSGSGTGSGAGALSNPAEAPATRSTQVPVTLTGDVMVPLLLASLWRTVTGQDCNTLFGDPQVRPGGWWQPSAAAAGGTGLSLEQQQGPHQPPASAPCTTHGCHAAGQRTQSLCSSTTHHVCLPIKQQHLHLRQQQQPWCRVGSCWPTTGVHTNSHMPQHPSIGCVCLLPPSSSLPCRRLQCMPTR